MYETYILFLNWRENVSFAEDQLFLEVGENREKTGFWVFIKHSFVCSTTMKYVDGRQTGKKYSWKTNNFKHLIKTKISISTYSQLQVYYGKSATSYEMVNKPFRYGRHKWRRVAMKVNWGKHSKILDIIHDIILADTRYSYRCELSFPLKRKKIEFFII